MLEIIYKGKDLIKIKQEALKIFDSLENLFMVEVSSAIVEIYNNRASFNKQLKRETPDWLVANASWDGRIDILSPSAMKNESCHNETEFFQILRHELTHLFVFTLAQKSSVPFWLNEGLAAYTAGQHQDEKKPLYIEENFCEKLGTKKGWDENVNYSAYVIASLFISFLVERYSFEKIRELLKALDKNYYYPNFKKIFFNIYKQDLSDLEALFVEEINK